MSNMEETSVDNATPQSELKYQIQLNELEAALLEQKVRAEDLQKENAQLKRENNQLKRMPLFVAVIVDILENNEIYLRQQGNNQEYITHASDELRPLLKPGTKVAVNNALSIVKVIGNVYDSRVRVMELEESPEISYAQIGGLSDEIKEVREAVEYPLTKPEIFKRIGVEPPKGILLYGSPGTGKTLIAKAVAHEAKATFIRMSGSELVHKFIGEGAGLVRDSSRSPASGHRRLSLSTRSMQSEACGPTMGRAAVPRCSGRSCSSLRRWTALTTGGISGSWQRRTGWTCWTLRSCGPDVLIA